MFVGLPLSQVELSSATLNTIKQMDLEAKSIALKVVEKVQAAGVYAASRALADADLLLRLSLVAISEVSSQFSQRMLPGSVPSIDVTNSSFTPAILSIKEKLTLVTLGIFPVET